MASSRLYKMLNPRKTAAFHTRDARRDEADMAHQFASRLDLFRRLRHSTSSAPTMVNGPRLARPGGLAVLPSLQDESRVTYSSKSAAECNPWPRAVRSSLTVASQDRGHAAGQLRAPPLTIRTATACSAGWLAYSPRPRWSQTAASQLQRPPDLETVTTRLWIDTAKSEPRTELLHPLVLRQ
jgi:hypothetical protein